MSAEVTRVPMNVGIAIFEVEKAIGKLPPHHSEFDSHVKKILVSLLEISRENHLRNEELNERLLKVMEAARFRTH